MKMILYDFRLVLRNSWLYVSVIATAVCLWLDLGPDSYYILHDGAVDMAGMLDKALKGPGSALSLPLLASLPGAAIALQELSAGAARMSIFRCGRVPFIISKLMTVMTFAAVSQLAGITLFTGLLSTVCSSGIEMFPLSALCSRMMSAMLFASVGGIGALLSGDTVSAYAVPTALGFALSMLSSRFCTDAGYIDPLSWLSGDIKVIMLLSLLLAAAAVLYTAVLQKEIRRYV